MRKIPLTQGRFALIDNEDYEKISQYKWFYHDYACRKQNKQLVMMHRFLIGIIPDNKEIDHINGDKLDNRRCNLRLATHSENQANKKIGINNISGFKGVSVTFRKYKGTIYKYYVAQISKDSKIRNLGTFKYINKAIEKYNKEAIKLFGEYAKVSKV